MGNADEKIPPTPTPPLPGVGSKQCFRVRDVGFATCGLGDCERINFSEPVSSSVKRDKYLLMQKVV